MTSRDKAAVIIVMWLIAAALSLLVLLGSISRGLEAWPALLVMVLIGSAVGGSIAITTGTKTVETPTREARTPRMTGKAKTSDMTLADRLIDSMSDEEIAALRRRLSHENGAQVGDDGEVVSLEEALRERRS